MTALIRKGTSQEKSLFYWKDERNREVDFVVCDGLKPLSIIQVSENTDDERIWKRESEALLSAGEALGVKDLMILDNNSTRRHLIENIPVKSILDWLLES
mgnify:CR=1 FL=1